MGVRGPIRDPESRRGVREGLAVLPVSDVRAPEPPKYLNAKEKAIFREIVADAQKAALTPLLIDSALYGKIARMELMMQRETEPGRFLSLMRAQLANYQAAGMTEVARRRLGIRPEKKKIGTVEGIIAAKRLRAM